VRDRKTVIDKATIIQDDSTNPPELFTRRKSKTTTSSRQYTFSNSIGDEVLLDAFVGKKGTDD
jgi:hypothetical protein